MKMKRGIYYLMLAALFLAGGAGSVMGQETGTVPPGIHYQAVARDAGGEIKNQSIDVKFSILAGGTTVYEELHHTTTSQYGVFSLVIGKPDEELTGTFEEIDWSTGNHSLQVDVDLGNGWKRMGTISFMSVPYALYAGKTLLQELTLNGDQLSISGVDKSVTVDTDPENELQDLGYNPTTRTLSITGGQGVALEPMVAFRASNTSEITLPSKQTVKLIFDDFITAPNFNIGGHYNPSLGEFRPSSDGIYTFNVSLELPPGTSVIVKVDDREELIITPYNTAGHYVGSITLRLSASNVVTVWAGQPSNYDYFVLPGGYFSGFRVF
jgi:hypothetical protein